MDKPQVLTRSVLFLFILLLALIPLCRCKPRVKAIEGKIVKLVFSYPCDSDKITIQRANGAPFYNSAEPGYLNLPDYHSKRFSVKEKNCSLQFQINPVMSDDEATYICKTYKDGVIQGDFIRVRLNVDYPPGKVSCVPSIKETAEGWIPLECEASVGSLPGEIICYQDAKRLPPYNDLVQSGEILKQTVWATEEHPAFCCSSIVNLPKDICECSDFAWDPSHTGSILHPCPSSTPRQGTTKKDYLGENVTDSPFLETVTLFTLITTPNKVYLSPWLWGSVITIIALLVGSLVSATLCLLCKSKSNNTDSTEKKDSETSGMRGTVRDCASQTEQGFALVDIQNKHSDKAQKPVARKRRPYPFYK